MKFFRHGNLLVTFLNVGLYISKHTKKVHACLYVFDFLRRTLLIRRFKVVDIPGTVSKGAPDFCTVYVVAKGKIQSMRSASRPAPSVSTMRSPLNQPSTKPELSQFSDPNMPMANGVKGYIDLFQNHLCLCVYLE